MVTHGVFDLLQSAPFAQIENKNSHSNRVKSAFFIKNKPRTHIFFKNTCRIKKNALLLHRKNDGAIAQLVEQRTENPCVPGSIPGGTTAKKSKIM